jgi:HK97 family phage prohead protease
MDGEFDEELIVSGNAVRLDRMNSGAPFLDTHGQWSLTDVIGSVVRGTAKIEGGKGVATVKLSAAADAVDRVARIKEGTVSNISVGYRIHAVERKEMDGKVPLHRVIDWEPWEISAVPIQADPGAQVRSAGGPSLKLSIAASRARSPTPTRSAASVSACSSGWPVSAASPQHFNGRLRSTGDAGRRLIAPESQKEPSHEKGFLLRGRRHDPVRRPYRRPWRRPGICGPASVRSRPAPAFQPVRPHLQAT